MIKDNIWDIKNRQQTQIKLDILRKYLRAWAIIIGSHFPKAYFVDCFAGRGKYHLGDKKDSVPGSPLIGIETSLEVKRLKLKKGLEFNLNIIAIELEKENLSSLKKFTKEANSNLETKVEIVESEFGAVILEILKKISGVPAFFFIDPYGNEFSPQQAAGYPEPKSKVEF